MAEGIIRVNRGVGELSKRIQGTRQDVAALEQQLEQLDPKMAAATRRIEELRTRVAAGEQLPTESFQEFRDTAQYLQRTAQTRLAELGTPEAAGAATSLRRYLGEMNLGQRGGAPAPTAPVGAESRRIEAEPRRVEGAERRAASLRGERREAPPAAPQLAEQPGAPPQPRAEGPSVVPAPPVSALSDRELERAQRDVERQLERAERDIARALGGQQGGNAASNLRQTLLGADPVRQALFEQQTALQAEAERRRAGSPPPDSRTAGDDVTAPSASTPDRRVEATLNDEEKARYRALGVSDEELGRSKRLRPGTIITRPPDPESGPSVRAAEAIAAGLRPLASSAQIDPQAAQVDPEAAAAAPPRDRRVRPRDQPRAPQEPETPDEVRRDAREVAKAVDQQSDAYHRLGERQRIGSLTAKGFRDEWEKVTISLKLQQSELRQAEGQFDRLSRSVHDGIKLGPREQVTFRALPARIQDLSSGLEGFRADRALLEEEAAQRGIAVRGNRLAAPVAAGGFGGGGMGRQAVGAFLGGAGFGSGSIPGTIAGAAFGYLNPVTALAGVAGTAAGYALSTQGAYPDSERRIFSAGMRLGGVGDLREAAVNNMSDTLFLRHQDTVDARVALGGRPDVDGLLAMAQAYGLAPQQVVGVASHMERKGVLPRGARLSVPAIPGTSEDIATPPGPMSRAVPVERQARAIPQLRALDARARRVQLMPDEESLPLGRAVVEGLEKRLPQGDKGALSHLGIAAAGGMGALAAGGIGGPGPVVMAGDAVAAPMFVGSPEAKMSLALPDKKGARMVRMPDDRPSLESVLAGSFEKSGLPRARMEAFLEQGVHLFDQASEGGGLVADFGAAPGMLAEATRAYGPDAHPAIAARTVGGFIESMRPKGEIARSIAMRSVLGLGREMTPEQREEFREGTRSVLPLSGGIDLTTHAGAQAAVENVFNLPQRQRAQIMRATTDGRQRITGKGTPVETEYLIGQSGGNATIALELQSLYDNLMRAQPGTTNEQQLLEGVRTTMNKVGGYGAELFQQEIGVEEWSIRATKGIKDAGLEVREAFMDLAQNMATALDHMHTVLGPYMGDGGNMSRANDR